MPKRPKNILPFPNTPKGRKPVVDTVLRRVYQANARAKARTELDTNLGFAFRAVNQLAAGRKINLGD